MRYLQRARLRLTDMELLSRHPGAASSFMPNLLVPYGLHVRRRAHGFILAAGLALMVAVLFVQASLIAGWISPTLQPGPVLQYLSAPEQPQNLERQNEILLLVIFVVMAATPFLAANQWAGYERIVEHMLDSGAIAYVAARGERAVSDEVLSTNRWIYNARVFRLPILILSVLVALSIDGAQHELIRGLAEVGSLSSHPWLHRWSVLGTPLGQALYLAAGTAGIYAVTVQNVVGCRIILAIFRLRRRIEFGVDLLNSDGSWGWRPVREVLSVTYIEIVIHGLGLLSLALTINPNSPVLTWTTAPAAEWALTLPFYAIVPIWLIARGMYRYRIAQRSLLSVSPRSKRESAEYSLDLATRMDRLNSVPLVPFLGAPQKTLFFIAQAANFGTCYGLLVALISVWRGK